MIILNHSFDPKTFIHGTRINWFYCQTWWNSHPNFKRNVSLTVSLTGSIFDNMVSFWKPERILKVLAETMEKNKLFDMAPDENRTFSLKMEDLLWKCWKWNVSMGWREGDSMSFKWNNNYTIDIYGIWVCSLVEQNSFMNCVNAMGISHCEIMQSIQVISSSTQEYYFDKINQIKRR